MRRALWVIALVALVAAGCGPAVTPSAGPTPGGEIFVVALPRIVVDLDEQGDMALGGVKLGEVAGFLGQNPAAFRVDKSLVDRMTAAGVQHLEVRQLGDRLALFENGKPLPHIAWTDESLYQAVDLAAAFGAQGVDTFKNLLPIVRRLGLDVAVRFPRGDQAEIPFVESSAIEPAPAPTAPPNVIARFEVKYDQAGTPAILGVSAAELQKLGLNLNANLDPAMLQQLQSKDIQNLEVNMKPSGLTIYANGNPLPVLAWDRDIAR